MPGAALILPVLDVDTAPVRALRERHVPAAADGIPAHMTLLGPFPTEDRLPLEDLHDLFASVDPFRLRFAELRSFPGVLWLAPEPARPVVALVGVLLQRWPQARRHGETFDLDEVVPHVTVAMRDDEQTRREFEDVLADLLPLEVAVTEAWFVEQDGERRWQRRESFTLGVHVT